MSFYQWLYEWWTAFVVMAGGALFIWLSLLLLGEYRKAFMASPMSVMSLDVLLSILRCGTPGAMALLGLLAGSVFLAGGFLLLVRLCFPPLEIWRAGDRRRPPALQCRISSNPASNSALAAMQH